MVEFVGIVLKSRSEVNMPGTLVEKHTGNELLRQYLATHKINSTQTVEELLGPDNGATQEEIQAEVDDFLRLRRGWRSEDADSHTRIV